MKPLIIFFLFFSISIFTASVSGEQVNYMIVNNRTCGEGWSGPILKDDDDRREIVSVILQIGKHDHYYYLPYKRTNSEWFNIETGEKNDYIPYIIDQRKIKKNMCLVVDSLGQIFPHHCPLSFIKSYRLCTMAVPPVRIHE